MFIFLLFGRIINVSAMSQHHNYPQLQLAVAVAAVVFKDPTLLYNLRCNADNNWNSRYDREYSDHHSSIIVQLCYII